MSIGARIDFEKLADEMCGKFNAGNHVSRCDEMEIDEDSERVILIEKTEWNTSKMKQGWKEEYFLLKTVNENLKKALGSILVLGYLTHSDIMNYRELVFYKKDFVLEVKTTEKFRETKIFGYIKSVIEEELKPTEFEKELKGGVFDKVRVEYD